MLTALSLRLALASLAPMSGPIALDQQGSGAASGRVLIIGLDGVRPDALRLANTPNIDGLIQTGAVSWSAYVGGALSAADPTHQITSSGPGWASALTGVWVDRHRIADNSFAGNDLATYPHFFAHVRAAIPDADLASIVHWAPINIFLLLLHPGLATLTKQRTSDVATAAAAASYLTNSDPDALFVHLAGSDVVGHVHGFSVGVPRYLVAIEQVDVDIGTVLDAMRARPNFASENWLVLVTTDHGGRNTSHGGHSIGERQTWMIATGGDTSNVRIEPGPGITSIAHTALAHLGVEIPSAWGLADAEPFAQPRALPFAPWPVDDAQHESVQTELSWGSAVDATSYTVLLGTSPTLTAPDDTLGSTTENRLSPDRLSAATEYYWRVDTTTPSGTNTGTVWKFTTAGSILDELVLHADFQGRTTDASLRVSTTMGGSPMYATGTEGLAIRIGSNSDYVSYGSPPVGPTFGADTDFSVAFWIRTDGFSGDPVFLGNKDWASSSSTGWVIAGDVGGTWQWSFRGENGTRLDEDRVGGIADGCWHHIAVSHDRDGDVTFYQDGACLSAGPLNSFGSIDALATTLGQDGTLGYPASADADFDELRIWARVVGASEVARLFAGGPTTRWRRLVGSPVGTNATPELHGAGALTTGATTSLILNGTAAFAPTAIVIGAQPVNLPFLGALFAPNPLPLTISLVTDGSGQASIMFPWASGLPAGSQYWFQSWSLDASTTIGLAASDPLLATTP